MGLPAFRKSGSVQGVVVGSTATVELATKVYKYRKIIPVYTRAGVVATTAQMDSDISMMRLKVDGEIVYEATPAENRKLNAFYNRRGYDHHMPMVFARPELRSIDGEKLLGLGTGNVGNLTVEFDIAAGAVTPQLDVYVDVEKSAENLGEFVSVKRHNLIVPTQNSLFEYDRLPVVGSNRGLLALHFYDNIGAMEVYLDDTKIVDMSDATSWQAYMTDLHNDTVQTGGRNPQASSIHLDFCRNVLSRVPRILSNEVFRLEVTSGLAAGTSVPVLAEVVHNLKG